MMKKPKNKPARSNSATRIERNSVSEHLVVSKKSSSGSIPSQSAMGVTGSDEATRKPNQQNLQPRPTGEDVDVEQFVSDLLVSDKDIMDYLAR